MPPARVTLARPLAPIIRAAGLACAAVVLTTWSCLVPRASGPPEAVTYHGLLPCRDCAAVATTLTLRGDGYVLERRSLGAESTVSIERGEAKLRYSGALRLYPEDGSVPAWLELDDSTARVLALDGHGYRDDTTGAYALRAAAPIRLAAGERELFVDADRVACRSGGGELAACLRVLEPGGTAAPAPPRWSPLAAPIAGFSPRQRRLYHLVVEGEGEATSLVRVVAEHVDRRPRAVDTYVLATDRLGGTVPSLRFDVTSGRLVGHDGCNPFQARLRALGSRELEIGLPAGPRAACADSVAAADFRSQLVAVAEYRLAGGGDVLELLDRRGAPLMALEARAEPRVAQ